MSSLSPIEQHDYSKYVTGLSAGEEVITEATERSSLNNREFICDVVKNYLVKGATVFEVGSGTAKQTVLFGEQMPSVIWQTSDREVYHPTIKESIKAAKLDNMREPVKFDIDD